MEWICAFHLHFFALDLQHIFLNRGIATFFACFFQFVHFFFRTFFCKFAISKQDLWESWKNTGKLQNKKMRKTCKTNATKIAKNAKQAKKTLKLENKNAVSACFFSDISLFFLGVCRVFLGFSRFLIPSKEALGILKQHAQKCEKKECTKIQIQNAK